MTEAVSLKPELGRFGVWMGTRSISPELAQRIEELGYRTAWIGGSPNADLAWAEPALEQTGSLQLATGIVNIWSSPAATVAQSYHRIENAYPGRFLLGIGVGHREHTGRYRKPYAHWSATSTNSTPRQCLPAGGYLLRCGRKCSRWRLNAAPAPTPI